MAPLHLWVSILLALHGGLASAEGSQFQVPIDDAPPMPGSQPAGFSPSGKIYAPQCPNLSADCLSILCKAGSGPGSGSGSGQWIPGQWIPGQWIPGQWIPGHEEPTQGASQPGGGQWVPGQWIPGQWIPGQWVTGPKPGLGGPGPQGTGHWVPGQWVPGEWKPGQWIPGYWKPDPEGPDVDEPGSGGPGTWIPGKWTSGQWIPGYWLADESIPRPTPEEPKPCPGGTWYPGQWVHDPNPDPQPNPQPDPQPNPKPNPGPGGTWVPGHWVPDPNPNPQPGVTNPGPPPCESGGPAEQPNPGPQPGQQLCGQGGPSCKWLKIQYADASLKSGRSTLDHPNKIYDGAKKSNNTQYWYPVDTWLVPNSGSSLEVFIKNQKIADCGQGTFFIPKGTLDTDVEVFSRDAIKYTFYGACSQYTPCVGGQIKDWAQLAQPPFQEGIMKDIDVSQYTSSSDVLFSIADTWNDCEQFAIYADGQELGRTHGPLTLEGEEKFNPAHIFGSKLAPGTGTNAPYVTITHGGFFGTFRIKQGTRTVTVKALNLVEKDVGWWYSYYGWRLDRPC